MAGLLLYTLVMCTKSHAGAVCSNFSSVRQFSDKDPPFCERETKVNEKVKLAKCQTNPDPLITLPVVPQEVARMPKLSDDRPQKLRRCSTQNEKLIIRERIAYAFRERHSVEQLVRADPIRFRDLTCGALDRIAILSLEDQTELLKNLGQLDPPRILKYLRELKDLKCE